MVDDRDVTFCLGPIVIMQVGSERVEKYHSYSKLPYVHASNRFTKCLVNLKLADFYIDVHVWTQVYCTVDCSQFLEGTTNVQINLLLDTRE